VKRTRRDEAIGVVIHICMETTQGNFLYSYLYVKLGKTSCFSFHLLCFSFYKIGRGAGLAPVGGGGGGKRDRRMNTVQIMYTHVCKCKNDTY
jgi:hypothetical protein